MAITCIIIMVFLLKLYEYLCGTLGGEGFHKGKCDIRPGIRHIEQQNEMMGDTITNKEGNLEKLLKLTVLSFTQISLGFGRFCILFVFYNINIVQSKPKKFAYKQISF